MKNEDTLTNDLYKDILKEDLIGTIGYYQMNPKKNLFSKIMAPNTHSEIRRKLAHLPEVRDNGLAFRLSKISNTIPQRCKDVKKG